MSKEPCLHILVKESSYIPKHMIIGLTAAISFVYFKTNFAELWCFFSAFTPLRFLGVSNYVL